MTTGPPSRHGPNDRLTAVQAANDDTITGHEMLGLPRGVPLRIRTQAFQAECRGFETRLPLHFPFRAQHDTQPVPGVGRPRVVEAATPLGRLTVSSRTPCSVMSAAPAF
jgi:hypothetical protein